LGTGNTMMKKQPTREKLLDITFEEVYIYGYMATSVDAILKKAGVPKGSMYHHFKGKKELVLAMVQERLFPKMDSFFNYELKEGQSVVDSFRHTFIAISKNTLLVRYGCPLYRLMVELSATDKAFDSLLSAKALEMKEGIQSLLEQGIERGELNAQIETDAFAGFVLSTVWGILSMSPSLSSASTFISQSNYIVKELEHYLN